RRNRGHAASAGTRYRATWTKRAHTCGLSASQRAGPVKARKVPLVYPTPSFAGLLFVLTAMWYAASSQNSAAVYLLLFALTAAFLVSIPHTLINLAGVTITLESVQSAFVGQEVSLPVEVTNGSRAP